MALSQREAFARTFEHLVTHDSHGYTQGARWGNGTKETVDLGDGVSVEVMLGDRDCSSGIISALSAVGVNVGDATYTGNMKNNILKSGLFEWYGINDFSAQRGDIYLNEGCHTAMCTSAYGSAGGDMLAEFSISENGTAYGNEGDQTGNESHICAYYDYPWDGILHWKNDGATMGETKPAHTVEKKDGAVYRLYNPQTGLHLFTSNYNEAQSLSDSGWSDEGVGWYTGDGSKVYRLYNADNNDHLLTTSIVEGFTCCLHGWKAEGVAFKAGTKKDVYRLYNPKTGEHFYTTNSNERDSLKKSGWSDEGVGFKGN